MVTTRPVKLATYGMVAWLALWSASGFTESDALLATVTKPATFTVARSASPAAGGAAAATRRSRVIVSVTNYHPANDGTPVEVIVRGRIGDGPEREVGRFAVTPDREFAAAAPADAMRFGLSLPGEFSSDEAVTFIVQLAPGDRTATDKDLAAGGVPDKGASIRLGEAEIR